MRRFSPFVLVVVLVSFGSLLVFAQTDTGTILGTVTNPTVAVVTGAAVTVTHTGTGAKRTTTTSSTGTYTVTDLPPGTYEVLISASGFAEQKQNVVVTIASQTALTSKLTLAAAGVTVEVSGGAGAVQVETQSSELSTVVGSQQVSELPSLTRNPYDFVALSGNAAPDQSGTVRGANNMTLNGQRAASTGILLDGAENVDLYTATVGQQVPLDSVQEFRVSTNNFGAEYGRASGGVVNVASKSGTNQFHGSAYEFNRLSGLATNTYDNNANGIRRPPFTRNQFGYSIGGPILHNKLFFYNTTEWIRVRGVATNLAYVPDPAFLALSHGNTQSYFQAFGTLKSSTQTLSTLTANDLVNLGVSSTTSLVSQLPPNTPALDLVKYRFNGDVGGGAPQNNIDSLTRIDYNWNNRTQLFGRYAILSEDFFPGFVSFSAYQGFSKGETDLNQNFLLSLTHTVTNN